MLFYSYFKTLVGKEVRALCSPWSPLQRSRYPTAVREPMLTL